MLPLAFVSLFVVIVHYSGIFYIDLRGIFRLVSPKKHWKKLGLSATKLGQMVGISKTGVHVIETEGLKNGLPPVTLVQIAAALDNDLSIPLEFCQACPCRQYLLEKQYPELKGARKGPGVITASLRSNMSEILNAAQRLSDGLFDRQEDMGKVIQLKQDSEILELELLLAGAGSILGKNCDEAAVNE